jgi:hypothetical protein
MAKKPAAEIELVGSLYVERADERLLEIVEVGNFASDAAAILSADEIEELKQEVACLRQLGSVIEGTGGLRKFRYGAKGKGKRGGARVLLLRRGSYADLFDCYFPEAGNGRHYRGKEEGN